MYLNLDYILLNNCYNFPNSLLTSVNKCDGSVENLPLCRLNAPVKRYSSEQVDVLELYDLVGTGIKRAGFSQVVSFVSIL